MEIGICIRSLDLSPREFASIAKKAEDLGYSNIWVTEELARSGFGMLSAAARETSRIALGTAIVSIYSRTPLTIAMEAATLAETAGSRFLLGLGAGGLDFTSRGHGIVAEKPIERMTDYVNIIRRYLAGDRVSYSGTLFNVENMRMWIKPREIVPICFAALNPRMLQKAGELADGLILNMFSPNASSYVKENLSIGAKKAGRDLSNFKTYSFVLCGRAHENEAELRRAVSFYCAAPTYQHMLSVLNFRETAATVGNLWRSGERDKAADSVPDALLHEVGIVSESDHAIKRLEEYSRSGIVPLLYPQPSRKNAFEDIEQILNRLAPALKA